MKINSTNNDIVKVNKPVSNNRLHQDFDDMMARLLDNDNKNITEDGKKDISEIKCHQKLDFVYHKNIIVPSEIKTSEFKNFLKEGLSTTSLQIKNEIDNICSDETGKNIDMETLNDFLDMYLNENNKQGEV